MLTPQPILHNPKSFFDLPRELLCIADMEGHFVFASPAWEAALGYPPEKLEGMLYADLVHPDDIAATFEATTRIARGEDLADFRNRLRHAEGTWRWIEWQSTCPDGVHIYAAARDVTERTELESARRLAERRLREAERVMLSRERNDCFCPLLGRPPLPAKLMD